VLIADDYMDSAESLAMLLAADSDFETEVALDGEEALERVNEWRPHICVLDLDMPKVDGREIARQIREQEWSERPLLIALTGWTSLRDRSGALDAGFDYYIPKPVDPSVIVNLAHGYRGTHTC
jgi:DNA-binding response OmpR family regulator